MVLTSGAYVLSDGRPLPPRPDHSGSCSIVADGALQLHHYILKSRKEFERKRAKWPGQDLGSRFTDEYFDVRDRTINAVRDERLEKFAGPIRKIIDRARAGS